MRFYALLCMHYTQLRWMKDALMSRKIIISFLFLDPATNIYVHIDSFSSITFFTYTYVWSAHISLGRLLKVLNRATKISRFVLRALIIISSRPKTCFYQRFVFYECIICEIPPLCKDVLMFLGEISGTLHQKVLEERPAELGTGCGLFLKKVWYYLSIFY